MSSTQQDGQAKQSQANSFYAALARTMTRGAALYFSRPVRLFRPSKVSGWMFLNGLASRNNASVSPRFVLNLVKEHGFGVLPRHFIPPLAINALLGTILWSSYSLSSSALEGRSVHPFANAAISGAVAGGIQAIAAAPAENVRILLEGGSSYSGWSSAWKDVFVGSRGTKDLPLEPRKKIFEEARDVRRWMREVGEVAGRGWHGWGWGFGKDVCGFSVFFTLFELTRRIASQLKNASTQFAIQRDPSRSTNLPKVVHGATLVAGGVVAGLAYDFTGRPFDVARRTVHTYEVTHNAAARPNIIARTAIIFSALEKKAKDEGLRVFFRLSPDERSASAFSTPLRQRLFSALRILGRVGPWGAGFLIWESFGPGLTQ
ncbi:hypothetical protein SCHPADRAFT_826752 [Schizopora paradoxa]|uniref:Mitochondrial carrier n=1 Tax=Schizopora paradoxa TaxID=27342 RepID=A0A0H2RXH1_9AGAM|nr:hypothetical protein SCHPADRAFT_826752 [Schizopora paradoxa]